MPDAGWWGGFRSVIEAASGLRELIALVCLFVLNNALWMRHLSQTASRLDQVLWELARQLATLNRRVAMLQSEVEWDTE
ncbi:MAG: hypothetical protein ABI743_07620 [bacterium]